VGIHYNNWYLKKEYFQLEALPPLWIFKQLYLEFSSFRAGSYLLHTPVFICEVLKLTEVKLSWLRSNTSLSLRLEL
jgi:hypothetical protein